ncbi:Oidioi.mRNA.OKI2018_I69.chr2.g6661.t1.cds [Oikopleura dioica]|uniref:Oidioi.mRNA.OKI2018_I69.chr2.g6661.t1.cds n=1 Tax=Oikopleura dioica TaxID=34765 RepID=A0ABN7TAR9_OIKDI|nr:Oidioi.mRNA.OKI2018_I69.chr2.g6661.t1.cds [Oikopleura dioica]
MIKKYLKHVTPKGSTNEMFESVQKISQILKRDSAIKELIYKGPMLNQFRKKVADAEKAAEGCILFKIIDSSSATSTIDSPQEDEYTVAQTFIAESPSEVTITKGETVKCLFKNESGWWFLENQAGDAGWSPASYLAINDDIGTRNRLSKDIGSTFIMTESHIAPFFNTKELTVPKGSLVKILQVSEFGWWTVTYSGTIGIVPRQKMRKYIF